MTTDKHQTAQAFIETHQKLSDLSAELAPVEERYLSMDGLGSAGMEIDGVLEEYTKKSEERNQCIAELRRLRTEAGDEEILSALQEMKGGEAAREYIEKVPLEKLRQENHTEAKRGLFGRMR